VLVNSSLDSNSTCQIRLVLYLFSIFYTYGPPFDEQTRQPWGCLAAIGGMLLMYYLICLNMHKTSRYSVCCSQSVPSHGYARFAHCHPSILHCTEPILQLARKDVQLCTSITLLSVISSHYELLILVELLLLLLIAIKFAVSPLPRSMIEYQH